MDRPALSAALAATPKAQQARFLLDLVDDLVFDNVDESVAVEFLTGIFDQYVVPYNVPGLPEFLEKGVEAQVRKLIPAAVHAAYEAADNDGPA